MKHMTVPMEIKAVDDAGTFSGYASIFGNVDLGGDIVEKGAFKQIMKNKSGKVVVLFAHDSYSLPIGLADVEQDEKGLAFDGNLVMDDEFVAKRIHPHMKAKSLDNMSIGYDILKDGASWDEKTNVRTLSKLKLWEISAVVFGMNPKARIASVKSATEIATIREFEDFLRDVGGYSKAQAKLLASGGYKALQSHRDDGDEEAATQQLVKISDAFNLNL